MIIKPREGRAIKNKNSKRIIRLVRVSPEAMRAFPDGFPTCRDSDATLSRTVNKYLRAHGLMESDKHVMSSLRHSYEDRLLRAGVDVYSTFRSRRSRTNSASHIGNCGKPLS